MIDPVFHPGQLGLKRHSLTHWHQRNRERLGSRLARKKLMKKLCDNDQGNDNDKEDNMKTSSPPLLLRRNNNNNHDLNAYLNVVFLNNYVLLALDSEGCIDAIRLNSSANCNKASSSPQLISHVESQVERPYPPSYCALHPFHEGNAFAVGLPSGQMRIFSTERESTWTRISTTADPNATQQQRIIHNRTEVPFLHFTLQLDGAQRRYFRHRDAKYSLANQNRSDLDFHLFKTVPNWDTQVYQYFTAKNFVIRADAIWSFSEENTSSLTAAHVHPESDSFVLQTVDSRTADFTVAASNQSSSNNNQQQQHKQPPKASVYIDMTSPKYTTQSHTEDITSLTFCSPYQLATAHRIYNEAFNNVITTVPKYQNFIKIWDIRMPKKGIPLQTSVVYSPSFPNENVFSLTNTEKEFSFQAQPAETLIQNLSDKNNSTRNGQLPEHSMYIANISAPKQHTSSSSICISMRRLCQRFGSDNFFTEDIIFDPHNQTIQGAYQDVHRRDTHDYDLPFPALCQNHELMVCYCDHDENEKISFFDLSKNFDSTDSLSQSKKRSFQQMRRSITSNETTTNNNSVYTTTKNRIHPTASSTVKLYDELQVESYLTCMALNNNGGSFVCGSDSGDLFMSQVL